MRDKIRLKVFQATRKSAAKALTETVSFKLMNFVHKELVSLSPLAERLNNINQTKFVTWK